MSQPEQQPAQAAGKKGKKKKGTTFSLTDFLGDAPPAPTTVTKTLDWADESEEFDGPDLMYQSSQNKQILSSLPTGPRSSRTIEVDMTKLPNEPPFTAFVGNLPYEVDEEMLSEFFKDLKIVGVRLPEENGRFKGYGYVEFADRHSLAEALQHNEETFNRRQIRVDVAGSKNQGGDNRRGNSRGYGSFGTISMDGPDVTESDWRKKPDDGPSPYQPPSRGYGESDYRSDRGSYQRDSYQRDDRYGSGSRDYGRSGYYGESRSRDSYQRSDSYGRDNRGYGRDQDNGYGQGGGYGGSRDYGGDRSYGSGGYGGSSGYGGGSRDYGSDRSYGSGYGGGSGNYNDRSRDYQSRDQGYGRSGYDRSDGYGGGSRGYSGSSGYGGDRYDSRDSGYGRDRYQDDRSGSDFRRRDNDYVPSERKTSEDGREESHPPARPTLKLQPRTKPIEPAEGGSRSSIFGGAKPVDTAAREKEIEEKLKKEKDSVFQMKDEREEFKRAPRRSSERSDEGHHSPPRRPSRRISSDKDYNDAHRRLSTSPGRQQEDTSPKDKPSSQSNYKPAPPPKQSAWGKGPTPEKHQQGQRKTSSEEAAEVKNPVVRPAPPPASNPWSRGPPKIDNRGVREEAEGNAREDDLNERTPEGAADDTSRGSDGSAGDGSDRRRSSPDRRTENKPRQYGDGRRDDGGRGQPRRQQYEDQSDYRRRGDGGSGKRNDWDRERPAPRGYDGGRGRPYDDRDRRGAEDDRRADSSKKPSQEKRDSSRDSRPECDRSAAVGQEQDFSKSSATKGRRQPKGPPELEREPVIEFVQKSKFSALPIEDDVAEDAKD